MDINMGLCMVFLIGSMKVTINFVPRPLLFFVLRFVFGIIHRSRRAAKCKEGLGTPIT